MNEPAPDTERKEGPEDGNAQSASREPAVATAAPPADETVKPPKSLHEARAKVAGPGQALARPEKRPRKKPPAEAEESIALRVSALGMSAIIITGAMAYAHANPLLTFACLWLAFMGTWLSYIYRERRPGWVVAVPAIGAMVIMGGFALECYNQIRDHQFDVLRNIIQSLAIFQGLHCFDLRTREDFSVTAIIGLALLGFASGIARDYLFLLWIIAYIISFSLMLYFDGVSRSKEVGPSKPVGEGRPASLPKLQIKRPTKAASIAVLVPVLSLPVLSVLVFYFIPRTGSVIELLVHYFISPNVAISQGDKGRGYNPGAGTPGMPFSPGSKQGEGGKGTIGGGGPGAKGGAGDPNKAINPLSKDGKGGQGDGGKGAGGEGGKGKSETGQGIGQDTGEAANYAETVQDKPEEVDLLRDDLPANQMVMRMLTSRPAYTRRVSLDFYDGVSWRRTGPIRGVTFYRDPSNIFSVGNANALLVPSECPTVEVKQQITIDVDGIGKFLPAYWAPQAVGGLFKEMTVLEDGSLRAGKDLVAGKTYQINSLLPIYRLSVMRALPERSSSHFESTFYSTSAKELEAAEEALMNRYRQLPANFPDKVKKLAVKVAGKEGNWFVKAERISNYLHKKFKFVHGTPDRMADGDFVYNFIYRTQKGNCVEFASAFVVMCRAAGIPARFVSGYLPGKLNKATGFHEVRIRDGHCWGEVYLPNWAWVPFDPAPGSGYPEVEKENNFLSALADMGLANPFGGAFQGQANSAGAGLGQGISGSELEKQLKEAELKKEGKAPEEKEQFNINDYLTHFRWEPILIAFILGATFYILNAVRRQTTEESKEVLVPANAKKSTLIFLEVIKDLKRYKIVRGPTDTPGDITLRIASAFEEIRGEGKHVHPELEPLIKQFMEVYHLDRFGRSDRVNELESMSLQIRELVRSRPGK
ncbi:MAG: DUF3488 domain-containing protein [Cyanobacteria bacterium HKST-UBA02]|nr:DUF3488 domain-containing protein [Cyanobacteria bacterium HKST-UBA02]